MCYVVLLLGSHPMDIFSLGGLRKVIGGLDLVYLAWNVKRVAVFIKKVG